MHVKNNGYVNADMLYALIIINNCYDFAYKDFIICCNAENMMLFSLLYYIPILNA